MKLLITSNIPEKIYDELDKNFEISYHDSNVPLSKEEIIDGINYGGVRQYLGETEKSNNT